MTGSSTGKSGESNASEKGLNQSAREQAEAWLQRLRKPDQPKAVDSEKEVRSIESQSRSSNTVEGIKQVELENGAILFTSDDG